MIARRKPGAREWRETVTHELIGPNVAACVTGAVAQQTPRWDSSLQPWVEREHLYECSPLQALDAPYGVPRGSVDVLRFEEAGPRVVHILSHYGRRA